MTDTVPALLDLAKQQSVSVASNVSVSGGRTVTGIIPSAGTTPTAGTGFTYTHAATGAYVFTFTSAFVATPIVTIELENSGTLGHYLTSKSAAGFTVNIYNSTNSAVVDAAFAFLATATA